MSSIHNALRRGPWSHAAQGILGDTREGGGIERLSESMTPTIDLWGRPDWLLYVNEKMVFLHGFQPAVAGEFSCCVFEAPATPLPGQSILVIDRLLIHGAVQCIIGYDARPAGATESQVKDFLDQRARPIAAARPRSRVFNDSNAATALTGPFFRFTPPANSVTIEVPFICLSLNLALIVEVGTVNTACTVTAIGRERDLLPPERD